FSSFAPRPFTRGVMALGLASVGHLLAAKGAAENLPAKGAMKNVTAKKSLPLSPLYKFHDRQGNGR
ncbi:MAG: hypothetical protein LBU95_03480, partial [Rikenellaceae bacterium]|nr:hypothetical protein [Rikenellaceae bacterium]